MNQTERFYRIDQLLAGQRCISRQELQEALGISLATLKRDLSYMRDRLHAPIVFDRVRSGYRLEQHTSCVGPQYNLPGLWFSADEIHALLTMQHLFANLDRSGFLNRRIRPLQERLEALLQADGHPAEEIQQRIRVLTAGSRDLSLNFFQAITSAVLRRRRLNIHYSTRGRNESSWREISPQRLVHYRDNWYLEAWCHQREQRRTFAVDAIDDAEIIDQPAQELDVTELDQARGAGYGLFVGSEVKWAVLRFNATRARWISCERWHPQQIGSFLHDGGYELRIPYTDDRELVMDVLKHGAACQVLEPEALRHRVREELQQAAAMYQDR